MKTFLKLSSLALMVVAACSTPQEENLSLTTKLFLDGSDPTTAELFGIADPGFLEDDPQFGENLYPLLLSLPQYTPAAGVSFSEAHEALSEALAKINHDIEREAGKQMVAIHELSHYLLAKGFEADAKALEVTASHIKLLAKQNPSELKVIYTGLTHLSEVWSQREINQVANQTLDGFEAYQERQQAHNKNLDASGRRTTSGTEDLAVAISNATDEAAQKEKEYTRYLEALVSK